MPKVKQISAWIEDRPGMLGRVADALGEKKVNIRAFTVAVMDGRGFVRVVVDKPALARRIFSAHGWQTTVDDLVEVAVPDRPGSWGGSPTGWGPPASTSSTPTWGRPGAPAP